MNKNLEKTEKQADQQAETIVLTLTKSELRLLLSNTDLPISKHKFKAHHREKIRTALEIELEKFRPIKEFSIDQTAIIKSIYNFSDRYISSKLGYKKG